MAEQGMLMRTMSSRSDSLGSSLEFGVSEVRPKTPCPKPKHSRCVGIRVLGLRLGLALFLIGLMICTFHFLDTEKIEDLATWLESHRSASGMSIFLVIGVIAVVPSAPGPPPAVLGGALYGRVSGFGVVLLAVAIGQSIAYVIGRFLLRDWVVEFASQRITKFSIVDSVIAREGWKIVFLLRLSPLLPDSLLNYVLAVTAISYGTYVVASMLAILPWTVGFVYIGSLAHNVAEAAQDGVQVSSTTLAVSMVASVVSLGIFGWLAAKVSRKALAEALDDKAINGSHHSA